MGECLSTPEIPVLGRPEAAAGDTGSSPDDLPMHRTRHPHGIPALSSEQCLPAGRAGRGSDCPGPKLKIAQPQSHHRLERRDDQPLGPLAQQGTTCAGRKDGWGCGFLWEILRAGQRVVPASGCHNVLGNSQPKFKHNTPLAGMGEKGSLPRPSTSGSCRSQKRL